MNKFEIKARSYDEALAKGVELTGKTLDELNFVCIKEPKFLFKGVYEVTIIEEEKQKNEKNFKKPNQEKQNNSKNTNFNKPNKPQEKPQEKSKQTKPEKPASEKPVADKPVKTEKPAPVKKEEKPEVQEDVKIKEQEQTVKIVTDETEEENLSMEVSPAEIDHFVREYIVEFARVQGVNVEVESVIRDGNKYYTLNGENTHKLIGYHGENLNAMQYIIAAVVNEKYHTQTRILLDTEKYKEKREESLKILARKTARRVIQTRRSQKLKPMNANERRIIHSELQSNQKVTTESHGTEPYRYVVIKLK